MQMQDIDPITKGAVDTVSVGVILGTLTGWLPHVAALVSIVWGLLRIYETETVKNWIKKLRG